MMDDAGNITPLYDKSQTITGGAGDLMLTITGLPGGGFEFCDPTIQTLTRGSQYQTSFLPEMQNGQDYKVKVKATYKDFLPIEFVLKVKYLPNLDGKIKFIDLGTHIFYKNPAKRPAQNFKFNLVGVTDNKVDDDLESYTFSLSDDKNLYFNLNQQDNVIEIGDEESLTIPHIGENLIEVSDEESVFHTSQVQFFSFHGHSTEIQIPLVAKLKEGELAVVLTWT